MASRIHLGLSIYFLRDKTTLFVTVCPVFQCVKIKASVWGIDVLPVVHALKSILQTVG